MPFTLPQLLAAAGQTLLIMAACFAVTCLIVSHLRFQALTRKARVRVPAGETPPEALPAHIAQRLGTVHRNPAPFAVMLVTAERWPALAENYGREEALELVTSIEARLRKLVRRGDLVTRFREDVVALLLGARREAADGIGRRALAQAARDAFKLSSGLVLRVRMVAGAAAYPVDGDRAGELQAKAEAALQHTGAADGAPHWPPDSQAAPPSDRGAHTGEDTAQKSLLDELTGVLQERRMGSAMQKYIARYRRDNLPVSILCLDIDYLRRYNDQYGRKTGDQLLRSVADYIQRNTREDDLIARWAGDQFVIAMQAAPEEALGAAQRLWLGIRKTPFAGEGPGLRLTATLGIANLPDHGVNARQVFEAAQVALHVAKGRGKNQCLMFDPSMRTMNVAKETIDAF